jgi:carbon-monoxide dehydrogenase small subunit
MLAACALFALQTGPPPHREGMCMPALSLVLNGQPLSTTVEPTTLLVELIRHQLRLTGTHVGCDTAQCGACTVLLDGQPVKSCSVLALQVQGRGLCTIEGLAAGDSLHPVQEAFIACHGLQCGYCTPGMVMASVGLLSRNPRPTEAQIVEALDGNLCRCTGYVNIVAAVQRAAEHMATTQSPASPEPTR